MVDPYVGEIRIFGFNYAPRGWATCDGQLLPLSQNTALFALLGTMYGGNGKSNFALPDLDGRAVMMWGQGPGLSDHIQGEPGGAESVTLIEAELPAHRHTVGVGTRFGSASRPDAAILARTDGPQIYSDDAPDSTMHPQALEPAGGSMPHDNMQPSLTMNFCIALQGVFPPRS